MVFHLSPFLLPFLCGIFFSFILDLLISIGPLISITKSSSYPFIHLEVIFNLGLCILAKRLKLPFQTFMTFLNFYPTKLIMNWWTRKLHVWKRSCVNLYQFECSMYQIIMPWDTKRFFELHILNIFSNAIKKYWNAYWAIQIWVSV